MYFVVMSRVNLIVILMTYVRYLYSINCPTVSCLPSMCYLSYGETPLVNCGPRSNFLYIALPFTITRSVYFTCITIILLLLDTLNPLFTANRWNGQPHRSWEQSSWLCCVQVPRCCWWKATRRQIVVSGALVRSVAKLASITFWSLAFSYWFDQP
jgi:hypothetical protein